MKVIIALVISLLSSLIYASDSSRINKMEDILFSQKIIFQEFNDPGWLITDDGKAYKFGYEGFTYENISTWKKGRELILTYSNSDGAILLDPKSGAFIRPYIKIEHPIDKITDACIDDNSSTMGVAGCYDEEYRLWDTMMNRVYQELKFSFGHEIFKSIQKMQRSWLKYRNNRFVVVSLIHEDNKGTITIIESSARAVSPVREQALYLRYLL
ncbi:MAG: hypothetical protein ACI83B_003365 [Sediminicola sp.]|jgi:uncharacterized protein YecT (DUF1311 family)